MCAILSTHQGKGEKGMGLLKIAVESKRWDLAAHTIVLAAARHLNDGERRNGTAGKQKAKKGR
jgi:hypothetical protein